jgi:hypothetical protein
VWLKQKSAKFKLQSHQKEKPQKTGVLACVLLVLRRLKQEDSEFPASRGCREILSLKEVVVGRGLELSLGMEACSRAPV